MKGLPTTDLSSIDPAAALLNRGGWAAQPGAMFAVFALGAYGLIGDSMDAGRGFWCPLHAAFGLSLSATIVMDFYAASRSAGSPEERRTQGRRLSRRVYLLLYGLLGVQQGLAAVTNHAEPRSFQPYLVCGLAAIVVIRVLAARLRTLETPEPRGNRRDRR